MNLTAFLGTTGLTDVGYRFIDNTGAFTGARQTSGVYELAGARGVYGVTSPTFPAGAVSVYWDSTGTAAVYAYETFNFRTPNADTGSAGALLTNGTGTAQLSVASGLVTLAGTQTFSNTGTWTGNIVGTLSALTTYTGNTPQTGDSFARIGAAGGGLTTLGDTRLAFLDATVSGRMAAYTQPTGFLAATFPGTVASPTNITAGTMTTVTNLTTYTGNTPQTGDSFARIGALGVGLTAIESIVNDGVVENSKTVRQLFRGMTAALLGKASGLATTTAVYRDNADSKPRITATVDADGNRSAVTLDLT